MSDASELIEQMEKETGQRIDDNEGENLAMAGLIGVLARALGKSPHRPKDDIAAGVMISYQMTPAYRAKKEADELMASLLASGISPDEIKNLYGGD
jgi:hypothetical protein